MFLAVYRTRQPVTLFTFPKPGTLELEMGISPAEDASSSSSSTYTYTHKVIPPPLPYTHTPISQSPQRAHTLSRTVLLPIHNVFFGFWSTARLAFGLGVRVTTTQLVSTSFALRRGSGRGAAHRALIFGGRLLTVRLGGFGGAIFPASPIGSGVRTAASSPVGGSQRLGGIVLRFDLAGRSVRATPGGRGLSRSPVLAVVGHTGVCFCAGCCTVVAAYSVPPPPPPPVPPPII